MAAPIALIPTLEGHSSTRVHDRALNPAPIHAITIDDDQQSDGVILTRQTEKNQGVETAIDASFGAVPELNTIQIAGTLSSPKSTASNATDRANNSQSADGLDATYTSDGGVNSYRMAMNTPNQTLRAEDGWKFIYAAVPGRNAVGSISLLNDLVQTRSNGLAVTIPVFHGNLSGVCQNIQVVEGGVIDCELKIWCQENGREPSIPESHGHNLHVRSDGQIHHVVVTLNMSGQEKIVALETTSVTVAFYQRDTSKQSAHALKP